MTTVEKRDPTFEDFLAPIFVHRNRILIISLVVAVCALAVNFLLPLYYKSAATLLPETQKDKLSALGQFADIASLAGVSVPGSEIARLYPTIVTSETILRAVIQKKYEVEMAKDSIDLVGVFGFDESTREKNLERAVAKVRSLLIAAFDTKTNTVSLSLEMPEPKLVADVLNSIIEELDRFMRSKKTNNASEQVKWIEYRLTEIENDLRSAEEMLKEFRERNRQVSGSPTLLLEQERRVRNVQLKSAVYIELKKQYELAKLEEIKNITVVNVLDPGRVPVRKSRPQRLINTVIFFLLSLALLSTYYIWRAIYYERTSAYLTSFKRAVNSVKS